MDWEWRVSWQVGEVERIGEFGIERGVRRELGIVLEHGARGQAKRRVERKER